MKKIFLPAIILLFAITPDLYAQCAMCRASVQTSISSGGGIGVGLNTGILYLGAFPYLVIAFLIWLWYKNAQRLTPQQRRYMHR